MQQHAHTAGRASAGFNWRPPEAPARILVVDDEPDACEMLRQVLESEGYDVTPERSPRNALRRIAAHDYDLVVTDVVMDEMNGLDLCREVLEKQPSLPVVMVTGRGNMDTVISALRLGARDFLVKPIGADSLVRAVEAGLERPWGERAPQLQGPKSARELALHSAEAPTSVLVGHSAAMQRINELIGNLSGTLASVLLEGETGTGKEVIARAIHEKSAFRAGPFVAVDCAAIPLGLAESELFGHARGAFTDAKATRVGLLVQADGGTLLLDEIGELPLAVQPKLLRALQERKVRPVGARDEVPFDCRIIAATNRDLEVEVAERRFREDLYYRLNVVRVQVPPLRERGEDVLELAQHFLDRLAEKTSRNVRLSAAAIGRLLAYSWPGNVRELQNCIERALALSRGEELMDSDLPEKVRYGIARKVPVPDESLGLMPLAEVERRHVLRAIELLGDKTLAAQRLGIDRRTLYRRLESYERLPDSSATPEER